MTEPQARLWATLNDLPLGPADAVVTFEDKLIKQTGWTRDRAARAVVEYRRYLLLAATCGHPVSPSSAVDEAWHLHLLYTRHYWQTLCPQVLKFDFHHEPATGTPADRAGLDDAYARTLASYQTTFNEAPPADLWPTRPSGGTFLRVDHERFVVLPRRAWRAAVVAAGVGFVTLLAVIVGLAIR